MGSDKYLKGLVSQNRSTRNMVTLLKPASQQIYQIYWSLWSKLSSKKPLLVIDKILLLLVNTLTTDDKYSLLNSDNLTQPIPMLISKKEENTFYFLFYSSNLDQILNILEKRWPSKLICFRNYGL